MERRLNAGVHVLDVGCSTGAAVISMAAAYPNSTIYGVDLDDEALQYIAEPVTRCTDHDKVACLQTGP